MSFHINSDKEKIRGANPKLIGDNEATIRVGSGANEREVFRAELDVQSGLPRIGINRTGQRVNNIDVTAGGSGYNQAPTVVVEAPPSGGQQALASAFIFNGAVVSIAVNDPGNGYLTAPLVSFTGGNGAGAAATSVLDTVDFELDINGAIRTSTSIISDTARILNLDIENFVTPDLNLRAPNLKTYMNATGTPWAANVIVPANSYRYEQGNVYQSLNTGTTGSQGPIHKDGIVLNGEVQFKHIGFRVNDPNDYKFLDTGDAGVYPRSITPLLGDRSDKIATTEYVLNLATNDVGGRVYVSQQIGSDLNDGRSAVNPVRSIKKAAQIAWSTPGVKETLIVSGGDYVEDNPISLPPDCSVVGDNLRLVLIRPANLGKHIFKFGDKNYVTGVTYRDKIDSNGDPIGTWDFAMVFDDKQRIIIDNEVNGDFGVDFPIGHQIFGPERFRIAFQNNTGLALLQSGVQVVGLNTGARADTFAVTFNSTTGANAYVSGTIDVLINSGSLIEGDQYSYVTSASTDAAISLTISSTAGLNKLRFTSDPTTDIPSGTFVFLNDADNSSFTSGYYQVSSIDTSNAPTYWDVLFVPILGSPNWETTQTETISINAATPVQNTIDTVNLKSIRAEGEVVSYDSDIISELPISRIDFSLQGDPSIATGGFQEAQFGSAEDLGGIVFYTSALVGRTNFHDFKEGQEINIEGLPITSPDLSFLNGKQRIYKVLEDADGRARRFVIPKKFPGLTNSNFNPGEFAKVKSYSKSITLSLLNSPNKFALSTPVERRFQDACQLIRNNRDYIAEEVVGIINKQFSKDFFAVYNIDTVNNTFDIFLGPTDHVNTYVSGGTVTVASIAAQAISDFVYDNVTGVATITTTSTAVNALAEDDIVKLADILISCSAGQKIYPSYSSPTSGNNTGDDGDEQCKQDVIHFLNALVRDLEFGSNHNVIEAAKKYIVDGKIAYIEDEIIQNVRAIEYARELATYAMCNWRIKDRTTTDPLYTTKHATTTRYIDPTIITATAGSPACADVASAIDTLSFLWVDVISNNASGTYIDAAYLIARNADVIADQALIDTELAYPNLNLSDLHQRKCRRDIKIVLEGLIRDLVLGGNHGIVSSAEAYFSGTQLSGVSEAQRPQTIYAFQRVKLYAIYAMRNWSDGNVLQTTPTGSTYVPATGALTVVIPDPAVAPVANSDRIAFSEEALTYSCAYNGGGNDAGPYRTDIAFGKSFLITNVVSSGGSTTISLNVGVAGSNTDPHTFVSALNNGTKIIYGPITLTSPIPKFEDWSILNGPGAAPIGIFTPTNATYDPANGNLTFTTATAHNLTTTNSVRFQPESLVFSCDMDGDISEHKYPKDGQPAYGNNLVITGTTSNTVTVNVGTSGPNVQFTPTAATYDPATGIMVLEVGSHTLDVGEGVVIASDSLTFTCVMDGNQSQKTYPRASTDYAAERSIPIVGKSATSISVNVGVSPANKLLTAQTGTTYDPNTGDLVLAVGQHGIGVGRNIVLQDGAVTFTCLQDNNQTTHAYPRSTDPASGSSLAVTAVGESQHTVTNAVYTGSTGVMVVTSAGHGFSDGDYVKFDDDSLTFTCDLDNNATNHTYPRSTDRASNRWLQISNKTNDTFEVNVGVNTDGGTHAFVTATSNGLKRQTGSLTVNVGTSSNTTAHTFVSGLLNAVKFLPQSAHTFVSASSNAISHSPQTTHAFKRASADSISAYASTSAANNAICAGVESSIDTSLELFEDILDETIVAGSTTQTFGTLYDTAAIINYPTSYIYDFQNQRMAIRGDFDDFPIIEASPYTQNASVISFRGGGGALVDGSKVKQPNCPFPGLEPDGSASFPNQGKSMVAAAFTIVSFGGTGYKVIEDGYTQLVSVFVIFCQDGVLCETGGYASITNSATNFGTYALRGIGYRAECYAFDQATVNVVSQTPTGRTTLSIGGIGREPLEHYVVKIDGYTNLDPDKEFFIDAVEAVTVGPPFSATITLDDGIGNGLSLVRTSDGAQIQGLTALQQALTPAASANATIKLHRPSIVNSSSHTWEFAGSGINYLALPENGGTKVEANEQVSQDYGRVYVSGTDELGDFKVGTFARIENRTGNITFTGTVTISEVEFLKLKGGDVVVTGFDASNTLGGANTSDSKLPTQKAVKDYITNNLGPYINKPYSTNAVPRALVELTDSGKISIDQIPALRPFQVFTVATQADRLKIEGALAGDIAIQQDTSQSFILNNDLESLFVGFPVDSSLNFTMQNVYTGSPSTGRIQATEYRQGAIRRINITDGGSGYPVAPVVSISGGNPSAGAVAATATCTIANGEVVTVTITENAGLFGGKGYTTQPVVSFAAPPGAGTQAQGLVLIESRLYGGIVNNIKMLDTDTFDDDSSNTINISRVINTSSTNNANWVSLSSNQIAASDITSGVIETDRLATGGAANSFTFLRGDQNFAPAVQSIKGAETRYFARLHTQASNGANALIFLSNQNALIGHAVVADTAGIQANTNINGVTTVGGLTTVSLNNPVNATLAAGTVIQFERGASPLTFDSSNTVGGFIDGVVVANPGSGYTDGQYFDIALDGGAGVDLRANLIITGGEVTDATVTNAGSGYTADFQITPNPVGIGSGSNLVLLGKVSTVNKQFANVAVDIQRVSDLTISADEFGTIGVARYRKSQFNIGTEGNGSITIKTGPDSGLDADLLDGQQGSYYLNGAFFVDNSIVPDKLASGVYSIDITGRSTNTLRVDTGINNPTSNPAPSDSVQGLTLQTVFNSSNGLLTAFPSVDTGSANSAKHLVMTLRNGESGIDATFGGVRQLAFGNDNRLYLRGSGDGVTTYGSWYEVWNSGNQGIDSGLDADKLDNKEGEWYQDGWNIKTNEIFDTRLPDWRSSTKFRNKIEVKSYTGTDVAYRILVRQVLDITPGGDFEPGSQINIYNINKQDIGDFFIDNAQQLNDQNDSTKSYTMLIGRLASGGNLETAVFLGVAGDERNFENFEIFDSNTTQFAELGNSSGNGFVRLGRYDGNFATNPYIWFNSSQAQAVDGNGSPSYNAAIIADGGSATQGSGSLEFKVLDENELKVNNNIIWNAGNVAFNTSNVASTASLKSAVMRDTSGNFSAGTITASITGAASLNVLKTGDTMTGALTITGGNNLTVQGAGALSIGGTGTIGSHFTVDSGVFYVNATDNVVNVGQTTNANNTTFNVYDANGSTNYNISAALSSQRSLYQSSVFNQVNDGESGIILQHGSTTAAQWGISAHRTGASVGELIVRTRTANSTSATRLTISNGGNVLPGADSDQDFGADGTRWQNIYGDIVHSLNSVRIAKGTANQEADLHFRGGAAGSGGGRGFRLGSNIGGGADMFEIYSSQSNGGDDWKSLATPAQPPALSIKGTNNRMGINTNVTSGTDTTVTPNVNRDYILNVQGDMNLNGQFFQNNAEFVTSRWTEATNQTDIYRLSKVGIGPESSAVKLPTKELVVGGDIDIDNGEFKGDQTLTGGSQWFSPGYFGVDRAVELDPMETYGAIKFRRVNVGQYYWWVLIVEQTSAGNYTVKYGAKIKTPTGGTTGEILEFDFSGAVATVGTPDLIAGKIYNLAWLSGDGGSGGSPSGSIYVDSGTGGQVDYLATNGAPSNGGTYTTTNNNTATNIHMQLLPAKSSLSANGFEQWTDSYGMFKKCKQTIDETVVVKNGEFIVSFGDLTIASGKEVTINSGGNWTIK